MAISSDFYGMAIFDHGDFLDSPINVQKEIQRFTLIDSQLYAMTAIFGDGVVDGWDVTQNLDFSISVSPGVGILDSFAVETAFTETVANIPPSSTVYIYAISNPSTAVDRSVAIVQSIIQINGLLLASVTTGSLGIENIDTSVRSLVGFKGVIQEQIALHHHGKGGVPAIDLEQEVQGLLPTSRMADIDASKIVGGRLPTNVLPAINHNSLKNIGTLTHPQLDSVVQSIQKDNLALLGEVASINLMKLILYTKALDVNVDRYFENELAIIPGISPDSYIDWDATTAIVNETEHCISGVPEIPITLDGENPVDEEIINGNGNFQILSITWDDDSDFNNAAAMTNLAVLDGVRLSVDTIFDRQVEDFEGVNAQSIGAYTKKITETNVADVIYDTVHAQGDTSGRFIYTNSRSVEFVRTFDQPQDWRVYDTLVIFVKNATSAHASVTLELLDDSDTVITSFILLDTDEDVTADNVATNGFAKKEYDLSTVIRNKITKLRIYTDTITNNQEIFNIDTIFLRTNQYLMPQGNLRLRYNTVAPVIFNALEYSATIPSNTDFQVRVRVASTIDGLVNATYTSLLQSGEVFTLSGSYIEIDITFLSDSDKTLTPELSEITLTMLAPSTESGLSIQSAVAWKKGTLRNIDVTETDEYSATIEIDRTNVNNFYFINEGQVIELSPSLLPAVGIPAAGLPIAPKQAEIKIHPPADEPASDPSSSSSSSITPPVRRDQRGLYNPKSAYRISTGNYVVADTYNDRVMEISPDGVFVRGWACHNFDYSEDLYALTSNYNPRLGVLFITLSKPADIRNFDLSLIKISIGNVKTFQLSNDAEKVRFADGTIVTDRTPGSTATSPPANLQGDVDRLLTVVLSEANRAKIESNITQPVYVNIATNIKDQIECFVGDLTYFGSFAIHRPVYANYTDEDRIIVCNSSVTSESTKVEQTNSVLEFTIRVGEMVDAQPTLLGRTFLYNNILFSDIMLGSVQVVNTISDDGAAQRKILMAGIKWVNDGTATITTSSSSSGGPAAGSVYSITLPALDDKKMLQFIGVVRYMDMDSNLVQFEYQCDDGLFPTDAFVDDAGNIVVAESTFTAQAGRIVTLDPTGLSDGEVPPIINVIEGGIFTKIWDIRKLNGGHIYLST